MEELTLEQVREAYTTLEAKPCPNVTWDREQAQACPIGVIIALREKQTYGETSEFLSLDDALGFLDSDYVIGVAAGFDGDPCDREYDSPEFITGYDFGRLCRKEFLGRSSRDSVAR